VAGDIKTPHAQYRELESRYSFFRYIGPEDQERIDKPLSNVIGWNCIQRRNFAFLEAHRLGADLFASVDDDNIPMEHWGKQTLLGRQVSYASHLPEAAAFDPCSATNHREIWHRGFPIQLLADRHKQSAANELGEFDIQADFWNGDPDVDAICRMEHRPKCEFAPDLFPFASHKPAPFNSQNTFLTAKAMPHYCMLPAVGRSDDIWPAYHLQALGFRVIFGAPSVVQDRNPQDVTKNFTDEWNNYVHNLDIVQAVGRGERDAVTRHLPERAALALNLYQEHFK
jgi:hypothetical protein